jgi:hypothetical protein
MILIISYFSEKRNDLLPMEGEGERQPLVEGEDSNELRYLNNKKIEKYINGIMD